MKLWCTKNQIWRINLYHSENLTVQQSRSFVRKKTTIQRKFTVEPDVAEVIFLHMMHSRMSKVVISPASLFTSQSHRISIHLRVAIPIQILSIIPHTRSMTLVCLVSSIISRRKLTSTLGHHAIVRVGQEGIRRKVAVVIGPPTIFERCSVIVHCVPGPSGDIAQPRNSTWLGEIVLRVTAHTKHRTKGSQITRQSRALIGRSNWLNQTATRAIVQARVIIRVQVELFEKRSDRIEWGLIWYVL